jgi:hypothetical protein
MPTYRPSARVRLAIRLDEGADTAALDGRLDQGSTAPAGQTESLQGRQPAGASSREDIEGQLELVQGRRTFLIENRDTFDPQTTDFFLSDLDRERDSLQEQLTTTATGNAPDATAGAPPDDRIVLGTILPQNCTIERNGIRTADTASVTIDYRDAPFDPRLIRSVAIEVIIGLVDATSYEAGVGGQTREDGTLLSLVPRGLAGAAGSPEGTTRFIGLVDEWTVSLDGQEGDTIDLACRDLTAILIDTPLPAGDGIEMDLPIDRGVRELLGRQASTRGTSVRFGIAGEESDAPTLGSAVPRSRRARRGRGSRRGRQGGQQLSLWDHITETTTQVGLVPVFEDNELRLIRPRTFYANRDIARRMVYGRNLESLGFSRKLGGTKVPTIEMRAYDPALGRVRWARYPVPGTAPRSGVFGQTDPPRVARANEVPPSGQNPDDRILTFTLDGITDPATLADAAESIWHQVGRQEIEGKLKTTDAWSWEEPINGVDLLRLRPGDAIELLVASPETEELSRGTTLTSASELRGLQREARANYLEGIGWSRQVAERFARLQDATAFQTIFRAQNLRIVWNVDDGLSVELDFVNFLEIRELGQESPRGESPSPEVSDLTEGRSDEAAEELRRISANRTLATQMREGGSLTEEQYFRRMDELTMLERQRVGDVQAG